MMKVEVEVKYIDLTILKYLFKPSSPVIHFFIFFGPQPIFEKSINFILVPSQSSMVVDYYKTCGRVFSNKSKMMKSQIGSENETT